MFWPFSRGRHDRPKPQTNPSHVDQFMWVIEVASGWVVRPALAVDVNGKGLDEMQASPELSVEFETWGKTPSGAG